MYIYTHKLNNYAYSYEHLHTDININTYLTQY